jgi:adenylosuccinate synthase
MPVTVIVGGQYGSEGKGKVAFMLARESGAAAAVRVGGSNSGHTVIDESGKPIIFRHLPTAALLPDVVCILPAGTYLDVDLLLSEVSMAGLASNRLLIDPNAMINLAGDRQEERDKLLQESIGSTLSGTGGAVIRRVARNQSTQLAKDEPRLSQFVNPVVPFMREQLSRGHRIVIEGTQGYGLSLLHSPYYPYATSRDTTAAGFVSEAGLSPLDVDDVIMVLRAFPIRVAGNSGPLPEEIDWETVVSESGSPTPLREYTSVTGKLRRVARFQSDIVRKAIMVNAPTRIVLNHLDYIDRLHTHFESVSERMASFVTTVESQIGRVITYLGLGPSSLLCAKAHYKRVRAI